MLDKSIIDFLYAVGEGIAYEAKMVAPVVTSNLKNDIKVYTDNIHNKEVAIGNSSITPYAKYVYFGTSPYEIKRKRKNSKKSYTIKHPGIKANPYLKKGLKRYIDSGSFKRAVDKANFDEAILEELGLDKI